MKKIVAILLALMLCLGTALAENADVIGTWYLNTMVTDGMSINPASLGIELPMTLNEDKTATMDIGGEVTEGQWAIENEKYVVTFEGDPQPLVFVLQDGNLVADQEGVQMVFGREKEEVAAFVLGEAKTDATMADYNGTWNATLVDFSGMQMNVADMDMRMQVTVADGKVTILEGEGEEGTTGEGTATVEDGVLAITFEGDTEATLLQLHEGDVLAWVTNTEDMSMSIYFEKAAE